MTQTLPQITEVIAYDPPPPPGTVYTGWSPRPDRQSPDINPPTDEFALLAGWLVHEADESETQAVIDLAAVMPQPYAGEPEMHETAKPFLRRGRRRMQVPPPATPSWPWLVLPLAGAALMLLAQVALLQVAIRVSGAVL